MFQLSRDTKQSKPEETVPASLKVKLQRRLSLPYGKVRTRLDRSPSGYRQDRPHHPSYPQSEILSYPVDTGGPRYHGRRHTHYETSSHVSLDVSASQSRSSMGSSSLSLGPEKQFPVDIEDDIFKEAIKDEDDRRPSFEEMQSEDRIRRPSVTVYQLEDSDHPDIKSIQDLVACMTFGDTS
eukprot:GFUD01000341.1.p1 GENE.GFUD01000341.1~~GFUD01000341.1.p1  ORF type:complete len:181 (-),score=43.73 GFUD01000341.1:81-623(-)